MSLTLIVMMSWPLGDDTVVPEGGDGEPSVGSVEPSCDFTDLGCIIKPTMSITEILEVLKSMGSRQKYQLLTNHFVPSAFPEVFDSEFHHREVATPLSLQTSFITWNSNSTTEPTPSIHHSELHHRTLTPFILHAQRTLSKKKKLN